MVATPQADLGVAVVVPEVVGNLSVVEVPTVDQLVPVGALAAVPVLVVWLELAAVLLLPFCTIARQRAPLCR